MILKYDLVVYIIVIEFFIEELNEFGLVLGCNLYRMGVLFIIVVSVCLKF